MNIIRRPFRYSYFNVTLSLILINVFVYFITFLFPELKFYLGFSYVGFKYRYFWQMVTYLFVHGGTTHLLFNMIALLCFGIQVEKAMGSKEFLLFYLICGVLDGFFSIMIYTYLGVTVFLIGASGAIYAILLAYAVIFPRNVVYIWGIIPVVSPLLVFIYGIIEIFSQVTGHQGVAHLTHLFGLIIAYFYFVVRMGINPVRVWKDSYR